MVPILFVASLLTTSGKTRPAAQTAQSAGNAQAGPPGIATERRLAATVNETRMVETVRRLVGFGPRMYGTPANTTDTEPSNMGWCARVGLLSALRLISGR